ncbi:MAG: ABC transporter substrate-binding protein [Planctomycetota bacterium]
MKLFLLLLFVFAGLQTTASGQWIKNPRDLRGPYVDSQPFDLIYLNDNGEDAILKVLPLKKVPEKPFADGILVFEYFAENEDQLEVPLSSVKEIKTYNELLIEEAQSWLRQKDYTKAFRNFLYVYDHGGKGNRELEQALKTCMFSDGRKNFESGEFELALSIYEDIYQRNPEFKVPEFPNKPLVEIVMSCYDGIIQKEFEKENYVAVREALQKIVDKYDKLAKELETKWLAEFRKKSDALLAQSKTLASQNQGREAHLAAKKADQMYPNRPEVIAMQERLLQQFPMIIVGINQLGSDADPSRLEHFGSRRVGRLTKRTMIELTGLTDEGGKYEFLNGVFYRSDEIGMEYIFEIKSDVSGFAIPSITAYEVAARLLTLADPESPEYDLGWARIVSEVSIVDESKVKLRLRSPYVRPEAILKIAYTKVMDDPTQTDINGAYVKTGTGKDITTFELNPRYSPIPEKQHPVIVEELFNSSSDAVDALVAGNIDVVDRILPADWAKLKSTPGVRVRPYLLPTVHMLVPKIRGELAEEPSFKSGLSHAINRDTLVNDIICGGTEISGCEPISGPFPIGTEENDQISYGYDLKVRRLPYDSQLGMVLIQLATQARPPSRPEPLPTPNIVLAHPAGTIATEASEAIVRKWAELGVNASTRKLAKGETVPPDEDWDFLYLEATIEEPLADATKLIGPRGFAKQISAPIEQSLRLLSNADSWQGTCSTLRRLHRQIAIDLSVIPLWQLREHYAYRTTVRQIGRDLIHLYQNVDRWEIDLVAEEDER